MSTEAGGRTITAADDDCLSSIAEKYGYFWRTIWFHAENAALRSLRRDPNVLKTGDAVYLPPKAGKLIDKPTDALHQFVRKGVPSYFRVRLMKDNQPRANEPFSLDIDGALTQGATDGDGRIEVPIPPLAKVARLTVGEGPTAEHYEFDLGKLEPVGEPEGAIKRLESLGYDCGLKKKFGLRSALRAFQGEKGLDPTGELDDATQDKLREAYGC